MGDSVELEIRISKVSDRYRVTIERSSVGSGATHLFAVPEHPEVLAGPGQWRDVARRSAAAISPLDALLEQGRALFKLVFDRDVLETFRNAYGLARQEQRWLRVRLSFDHVPEALQWPWEALTQDGNPLARLREPQVSIERRLLLPQRPGGKPVLPRAGRKLGLVAGASPADMTAIDAKREIRWIKSALAKSDIDLRSSERTTRTQLDKALAGEARFDLVHFLGHGDFEGNQGGLWLEGPSQEAVRISSQEFPAFLGGPVPFVFLNACHGGRGTEDPTAGLAEALLGAGTSAVIAMRREISNQAAEQLAKKFYKELAFGESLTRALAKARRSIETSGCEWATPVLYLADEDFALFPRPSIGELLSPKVDPPESSPEIEPPSIPSQRPLGSGSGKEPRLPRWIWVALAALAAGFIAAVFLWPRPDPDPRCPSRVATDPRCPAPGGFDLPMVFVENGSFDQGSTTGEKDERPVHRVTLTRDFCIGAFEVTRGLEAQVMGLPVVPEPQACFPVDDATWLESQQLVRKLEEIAPGAGFRLPTNAEWEYAARAGLVGDEDPATAAAANCSKRSAGDAYRHASAVGSFPENAWGLYDMKGNVWEWVEDWEEPYPTGPVIDRGGPATGELKVRRGGSYKTVPRNCRISTRNGVQPERKQEAAGFRVVRDPVLLP